VFTRDSNGVWTQQGAKLVGNDSVGVARQGTSVALSADGNTAIVGGSSDDGGVGAAWVFTRDGNGVWTQQGPKLVGTGATGDAEQGFSVALSADGNTAIVGGPFDRSDGAAWVFTRSSGIWMQQGDKLVGAGAVDGARQGTSVALSADGNTAIVGGDQDNFDRGAAWLFSRSRAGVWTQLNQKLVGTGAAGNAAQGISVALSGDGNTAMVGGYQDNGAAGAVWVFGRPGVTEVFPDAGTVDGGTNVLILGSNLRDVTGVTFGGVPATDVFEVDPGAVFATTPPRAAGRVHVIVTTKTGRGLLRRGYTYQRRATDTSLASSRSPSRVGQRVRFTATVSAGGDPVSGRVTFEVDGQALGTRRLRGGVATIVARDLAAGAHRVRAIFLPNGMFASSRAVLRQRVRN
jgi:hypothetical protein